MQMDSEIWNCHFGNRGNFAGSGNTFSRILYQITPPYVLDYYLCNRTIPSQTLNIRNVSQENTSTWSWWWRKENGGNFAGSGNTFSRILYQVTPPYILDYYLCNRTIPSQTIYPVPYTGGKWCVCISRIIGPCLCERRLAYVVDN